MPRDSDNQAVPLDDLKCDFEKIEEVDLAQSDFMISYSWKTGRLHPMILRFTNLKVLRAEKLGIIVVDEWIVRLKHLREIYFAGNEITTWPQHLCLLSNLKIIMMDGNPCLELQLRKSSSFRDTYFRLKSSNKNLTVISDLVKGPEWPLAVQKRFIVNTIPGTFCGGLYRLAATPVEETDDFMTTMGPSRLDLRKTHPPPLLCVDDLEIDEDTLRTSQVEYDKEECAERSELIIELLRSIYAISGRYSPLKRCSPHYDAFKPADIHLVFDKSQFKSMLVEFISSEHRYTIQLQEVLQLFLSTNVPSPFVKEMSVTFDSFPEIYLLHTRKVLPILKNMYRRVNRCHPSDVSRFCEKLGRLFKRNEFDCYIAYARGYTMSQWRLWCSINPDIQFDDELSNISGRLGEWLYKEAMESPIHSLEHAASYLDIPFQQMTHYCDFFKSLSRIFPQCEGPFTQFSRLEQQVRELIEDSRRILRVHRLCEHYKLTRERVLLLGYQWDALLKVSFRVYLEPGSNRDKTNDVLSCRDDGRMTMSVVSEVFSGSERKIRLILCQNDLQIWDESVGKMIGAIDPRSVSIDHFDKQLRVTFESVDETVACTLVSFACVDIEVLEGDVAFIKALDRAQLANDVQKELNQESGSPQERLSTITGACKNTLRQSIQSVLQSK